MIMGQLNREGFPVWSGSREYEAVICGADGGELQACLPVN